MAEENQAQQEPKEPQQVTTKDPKKVEAGKRLAAINHKKREEQVQLERDFASGVNQYYGMGSLCDPGPIGAIIAVGVIGDLGYYIYQNKKGQVSREVKDVSMPHNPPKQPHQSATPVSLIWIKSLLYYKNGQEEYSK